jgi:hypothetical protein
MSLRLIGLAIAAALTGVSCSDASGCSSFNPSSNSRSIGERFETSVEVVNGGWAPLDAAGQYWSSYEPVTLDDGTYDASVTYQSADTMLVELHGESTFTFNGPVSCE